MARGEPSVESGTDCCLTLPRQRGWAKVEVSEQVRTIGHVGHPVFAGWIARHGARLGLRVLMAALAVEVVEVRVSGPPELLDAMEPGCSLGPCDVGVERIERRVLL